MELKDVLYKVPIRGVAGATSVIISDLQLDSRKVRPGAAFIAVKGAVADGHLFIEKAIENGAAVVVCEEWPEQRNESVVYVQVENSAAAAGFMACNFYGRPSEKVKLVGVTGTNGKNDDSDFIIQALYKIGI